MTNKSVREIQDNLNKVIKNLGNDKASEFLETVLQILRKAVDNLLLSIEAKDLTLCQQSAHKLKGSSNLYGSQTLVDLLVQIESTPEVIMNDAEKYQTLLNEFELVVQQVKIKISEA